MSSLKVKQTKAKLLGLFEDHLDLSDIGSTDPERENKILSRCLAAFAVFREAGCSPEDAAAAVWDGSDDNGIDAAFVDTTDKQVILVQAKWIHAGSGEPEAKDLRTFADGVRDLMEQENDGFHTRLHSKLSVVQDSLLEVGTTTKLIIATTGKSDLAPHGTKVMQKLVDSLNGEDEADMAEWSLSGLSEIYASLASDTTAGKISVDATLYDWSYFANPYAAYFGVIDGLQLKTWWQAHGNRLVAKNIRHSLGATDVNDAISHTAATEPEKFWYFNNGITIVADEAKRAPGLSSAKTAGNFSFAGASIVNGAQTVSTLARVDQDENLGKVRIPIRVVLLKDAPAGFGGEVTRTNNLQNRVEARDFVAQDPEQARLQQEMSIEDVNYQFLRGERATPTARSTDLIEVLTALACAAPDPTLAVLAKTAIGRFFADLKRAPYKTIFNSGTRGARAFNSVLMQRKIEEWIDQKKRSLDQKKGLPWGLLVHGNRVLESGVFRLYGEGKLNETIQDFAASLDEEYLVELCELIYEAMLNVLEREHEGRFMAVLFKGPTKSKEVLESALADIALM
ncbi:AIPR family protein [Sphingomonas panaciterrae]|uniref:AIPR family protein n=1 Tax=Sphingomonas panaciterrae TaxID=1462999 RepID=UPI002FF1BFDA